MIEDTMVEAETPTENLSASSEGDRLGSILDDSLGFESSELNEESSADETNAPAKGNPMEETPEAPESGEPASSQSDTASGEDEAKDTTEEAEDNSALNALLDVEPEETSNDPSVWKGRYSDATRHIGELKEQLKSFNEVLLSQGRQIVHTAKGFELAVTDEGKQLTTEAVDPQDLYQSLSQDEKEMFIDDPEKAAKMLVEKTVNQIADKFVPATARSTDKVLTQAEADNIYNDFTACKLPDGQTARFPDADNPEVKELMAKAYNANTEVMDKFRDLAQKDPQMQYAMLEYLYNKVYRARQTQLAIQAQKKKAVEETQKKHSKESKLSSSGSTGRVAGQQGDAVMASESDRLGSVLDETLG